MIKAPKFPKDCQWLNTEKPLTLKDLKGHVVLLDFWTYCCINCIHVIQDLKYLEHEFSSEPLIVVGVHSAKFHNEKDLKNIQSAVERYEIEHPVIVDNNHNIWQEYQVSAWPTFVLLDAKGNIRMVTSGEGRKTQLKEGIKALLQEGEAKKQLTNDPLLILPNDRESTRPLSFPGKITFNDTKDTLFISNSNYNQILITKVINDEKAEVIDTIGNSKSGLRDGSFDQCNMHHPQGLCYHDNKLYFCDTANHVVREADIAERNVKTIAGSGKKGFLFDVTGANANQIELSSPWDIVFHNNELYICMAGSHQIWKYSIENEYMELFAGNGHENLVDGFRLNAQLAQPSGIIVCHNLMYFVDSEVSALRRIDLNTDRLDTIIGKGLFSFGHKDGSTIEAELQHPLGVCCTGEGIYVADSYNHAIRHIDFLSGKVSTLIGKQKETNVCHIDDLSCDLLALFEPNDVQLRNETLYIADTNNHLIRTFNLKTKRLRTLEIEM